MTIKHHIIVSALLSVTLIAIVIFLTKFREKQQNHSNLNTITSNTSNTGIISTNSVKSFNPVKKNLFVNSDFLNDFKGWSVTGKISIMKSDENSNFIQIEGNKSGNNLLWQNLNVQSGKVYRISFEAKSECEGSFAAIRYLFNEDNCVYTEPSKEWVIYNKDFNALKSGKIVILFSSKNEGLFFFRNISLNEMGTINE